MNSNQVVLFIKFKSELTEEEVLKVADERIELFRAMEGLEQKYYVKDPETGEFGGIYIWRSREELAGFRTSEISKSIARAYRVVGTPKIEVLEIVELLR